MNTDKPPQSRSFSSEARVGTGITIAGLGFLGVLLAWAEQMRGIMHVATSWLVVGAIFMVVGIVLAISGRSKK